MGAALAAGGRAPAEEAIRLAASDVRRAGALARAAAAGARGGPPGARAAAARALGVVAVEAGRLADAVAELRRAVRLAGQAGDLEQQGEARLDLANALLLRGDVRGALAVARAAAGAAPGRLEMRRALVLQRLGDHEAALDAYRRALPALRRDGDREWEARLLCNRGVLHAYRGALAAADADLRRAEALHEARGAALAAAQVRHNRGFVAARRGDAPAALALLDDAGDVYRRHGAETGVLELDRCEVLVAVGLLADAQAAAAHAVAELGSAGMEAHLAEAQVTLAQVALLAGDAETARRQAQAALRALRRQRRPAWAALARHAELRATWAAGERGGPLLARARRTAAELERRGWHAAALDARVLAARLALDLGRADVARAELGTASAARRRGAVQLRVAAWHAEALLRLGAGDERGAGAAVRAALRCAEQHRATMGATELRAHAGAHAAEVAALAVRLALRAGRPARVLEAAERWRAGAWQPRPVRPPQDPALADDLAELRRVAGALHEALLDGEPTGELERRRRAIEERVRRRAHRAGGDGRAALRPAPPRPADLAAALGDAALVELVEVDGRLCAVSLARGRARLHELGRAEAAGALAEALGAAQRRLALGHRRAAALLAVGADTARRLDALLLAPLAPVLGDRPLVLVPTGRLHHVPWAALPSCAGRPVAVAPSAALWHRAATAPAPREGSQLLVAGPRLAHAEAEIDGLRALHPGATLLTGDAATAGAVAAALAEADDAHVAAHASFRADNPLFSSLELADGPLTVFDIEGMGRVPRRLVLSACDSGRSKPVWGDALLGLGAALLGLGTATLVGSVAPVRDEDAQALMLAFRARTAAGQPTAAALAAAQAELAGDAPFAAGAAFVCLGAG